MLIIVAYVISRQQGFAYGGKGNKQTKVGGGEQNKKKPLAEHFYCPLALMFPCQSKFSLGIATAAYRRPCGFGTQQ